MKNEELLVLLGTDPTDTRDQLSELTRNQLSGLTRDQLSGLTRNQLSGLTRDQLSWLTGDQLSGLTALLEKTPVLERPYSAILEATNNCSANFDMGSWHCGTTHCAAGWIVTKAGEAGAALEREFDTPTAARLILRKSCPSDWPLPNFYAKNDAAAAFIRAMAVKEVAS